MWLSIIWAVRIRLEYIMFFVYVELSALLNVHNLNKLFAF